MLSRLNYTYPLLNLFRSIALVGLCFGGSHVLARDVIGSAINGNSENTGSFEHTVIDSILIDNRNVYDLREARFNKFPYKTANKLHVVTRRSVVDREILFKVGDPFSKDLAVEIARNLRTRLALYDAWVEADTLPDGRLLVRIVTIDQWSLIAYFKLAREAQTTDFRFGLEERNLLGRNQFVSLEHFVIEQERDHSIFTYSNHRAFGYPLSISSTVNTDPTNDLSTITLAQPYYNLNQSASWNVSATKAATRKDNLSDTSRNFRHTDDLQVSGGKRWGSYHNKFFIAPGYLYRYTRSQKLKDDTISATEDTTYHRFMLYTGFEQINYLGAKRIRGFKYTEDISLGFSFSVGFGRAFSPGLKGFYFDELSFGAESAFRVHDNLFFLAYDRRDWLYPDRPAVKTKEMSARWYQTSLSFATLATQIKYKTDERSTDLYLGGKSGVRGYMAQHEFGDRLLITNAEIRFFPGIELLTVLFGGVVFVDAGRAFQDGERFGVNNLTSSWGAGLRFSFERTSRNELARIDFARTRNTWEISIGSGQYF